MDKINKSGFTVNRILSIVLILVGVGFLLYPLYTNEFADYEQDKLIQELEEQQAVHSQSDQRANEAADNNSASAEDRSSANNTPANNAGSVQKEPSKDGKAPDAVKKPAPAAVPNKPTVKKAAASPMFILEIPALKMKKAVVRGTTQAALKIGPGWYIQSALPGHGNTAIAGHRTMYGEPFRYISSLKKGNIINIRYNNKVYRYNVERVFAISQKDWSVIKPCGYNAVTLTSCNASGHTKRWAVRARMVEERKTPAVAPSSAQMSGNAQVLPTPTADTNTAFPNQLPSN